MQITRFIVQACCGKTSIIFTADQSLTKDTLASLVKLGFIEAPNFTTAGILYCSNNDLIIIGTIGSNRLQVKCKSATNCEKKVSDFEELIKGL
jgi:hypothetical protein